MLKAASTPMILVGSEFLQYDQSSQILESIERLARNVGAGVLPLPAQNNLLGSILMGAYPELLPGGFSSHDKKRVDVLRKKWREEVPYFTTPSGERSFATKKKLKVLYLVGETPADPLPPTEFLIVQNTYPPDPWYQADLALASAGFGEVDGTSINGEGRVQRLRKAVEPPGDALPDWEILCRIARKMGRRGFDFSSARDIHKEISSLVKGFGSFDDPGRKASPLVCEGKLSISHAKSEKGKKTDGKFPFLLYTSIVENTHRGFPLTAWVQGAAKLFPEAVLDINSEDARRAGVSRDDKVIVTSGRFEKIWPARISDQQPKGTLHVTLRQSESVGPNPHPVRMRKKDV
jgi:predicted molibdopterin-dependent oxidoreductase YjgC